MTILPKIRTRFGENIGVEVFIQPPDLAENEKTFISTDASASASSFTVEDGLKFSAGEYVVVGNVGAEKAEIVRIHASSAPSATAITLNATTNFAHNRGEKIQFIPYNQVVIQRSTDSGSTYSDLATIDLRVDTTEIYYQHAAGTSTNYYRAKFKNSTTSDESQVSDGIIATGFVANSAGAIIRQALISSGEKIDGEVITKEFLLAALDEGRQEVDRNPEVQRWSFRTVFDYDAGNVIPGQFQLTLPTDLRDEDTFKSILALRIGKDSLPLTQSDKRTLNRYYQGIAHTTLNGAVVTTDTSITLTSSGDFDESGSISVAAAAVSGTIDIIAYTANAESTNIISGVTGIIAAGHATGKDVWQGASFGSPTHYTVYENKATFSQPFEDDLAGENIWLDYYKKMDVINSEGDLLDEPFYYIYVSYLRYRIKLRKDPQMNVTADVDYAEWKKSSQGQALAEWVGQDMYVSIDVPGD